MKQYKLLWQLKHNKNQKFSHLNNINLYELFQNNIWVLNYQSNN